MPAARRPLILVALFLMLAAGLGRLSIAQADPPGPPIYSIPSDTTFGTDPDTITAPPTDFNDLWNLRKIGLPCDPPYDDPTSVKKSGVVVAVVDTGVDSAHPLFAGRLVAGYDFVNDDPDPFDDQGHGTHVAGIVLMVAPAVKIMPVKALSARGAGASSWIASAIIWATDQGADVINLSLGGPYSSGRIRDAVEYAGSHGVVLPAAAGHDNTSNPTYPAAYPQTMAVSSTTQRDERAAFSNYGAYVSVAAPGISILGPVPGGGYQAWSGTSQAAPHVSALAGLVKAYYPAMTGQQIRDAIDQGADDLGRPGWDPIFGYGRINVCRTLELARSMWLPPVSATIIPLFTPTVPTE